MWRARILTALLTRNNVARSARRRPLLVLGGGIAGAGRHRLARVAASLGIDGLELLNPFQASDRSIRNLQQKNSGMGLLAVGGSDAHHVEDLYKVIVDFPGHSPVDLKRAFYDRTAVPRWGWNGTPVSLQRQAQQHARALVYHPYLQMRAWTTQRLSGPRPH